MLKKSRIAMLVAGAMAAAQVGAVSSLSSPDAAWVNEYSSAEQISVFNPDGSSYSIVPAGIDIAQLEPLLIAAHDSMPDQLTVFEPDGSVYSFAFTPVITMWEPVDILVMEDDLWVAPVALMEENVVSHPTYVAHFVSPPAYTGLLEASS